MNQPSDTSELTQHADCLDFFQQMILNGLRYWQEHPAVQEMDVAVLDRERDTILKALGRGLEFDPAWPLAQTLIGGLASFMERRGYWSIWRALLEDAILTAQRVDDVDGETTMTALLARLSQRQSRGADVVRYYRRVMRLAKQSDNQFEYARACCNLGYYYIDASRWWRSEVLSLRALEIFEELVSDHGRAHTHNHLGLLYTRQQRWGEAEQSFKHAHQFWMKNEDQHNLVNSYINLGVMNIEMYETSQALRHLENAYQLARFTGDISQVARVWQNMAVAHRHDMNWEKAEHYAIKAENEFRKISNQLELARIWQTLGVIHSNLKQTNLAIQYFTQALRMYQTLQYKVGEKDLRAVMKNLAVASDATAR